MIDVQNHSRAPPKRSRSARWSDGGSVDENEALSPRKQAGRPVVIGFGPRMTQFGTNMSQDGSTLSVTEPYSPAGTSDHTNTQYNELSGG